MSDSIESIYLAAKEDPHCDAYWIPIPFFEKNVDGTLGRMHYEGAECYSDKMECIDWMQYDIEARRPDVIVTFAPYDSNNHVTSVHPLFYCERLRKYTGLLLYVPYFVANGGVEEVFVTVAGCVFAHKVIVQSEPIRNIYCRVFEKHYADKFGRPEDKFVALGSPKYDKLINTTRENCQLPDAWRELIGNKKVVLYNTSVGAVLRDSVRYLQKLRSTLETFRIRNDVVLWWRPHPLMEETFKSMRPELLDEYKRIVAEYRAAGRGIFDENPGKGNVSTPAKKPQPGGIFDDSPDLHRAIVWSDAYYGDGSSVVQLYEKTGKPVMIQNLSTIKTELNSYLRIVPLCKTGNALYASDCEFNGFFEYDLATGTTKHLCSFLNEPICKSDLFYSCVNVGDEIYFAPMTASSIVKLNIKTKELHKLILKKNSFLESEYKKILPPSVIARLSRSYEFSFASVIRYKDILVFIPYFYSAIVIFDIQSGEVEYCTDWVESLLKNKCISEDGIFRKGSFIGSYLYLPCIYTNKLLRFDMQSKTSKLIDLPDGNIKIFGLVSDNEFIYFNDIYGNFYRLDPNEDVITNIFEDTNKSSEPAWHTLYYMDSYLYAVSCKRSYIIKYGTKNRKLEKVTISELKYGGYYLKTGLMTVSGNTGWIQIAADMAIAEINLSDMSFKKLMITYPPDYIAEVAKNNASTNTGYIVENSLWGIGELIDFAGESIKSDSMKLNTETKSVGNDIYRFIKKAVLRQ
jgi:hypothetical protein